MGMNKFAPTGQDVEEIFENIPSVKKQADAYSLVDVYATISGEYGIQESLVLERLSIDWTLVAQALHHAWPLPLDRQSFAFTLIQVFLRNKLPCFSP